MKFLKLFSFLLILFGLFIFSPNTAHAASVNWSTDRVVLSADDFSLTTNGKTFTGGTMDVHSDNGSPTYTTLEVTWNEQGVEMRLYMYFSVDNGQWKVTEIRTYNGQNPGDWLFYSGFTGGNIGSTYTTGSFDATSTSGNGNGTIHFSNFSLTPTFTSGANYDVTVYHPNGGESLTTGLSYTINWGLSHPSNADANQTYNTSIYLNKSDGTRVLTIADNQNITKINDNTYSWTVSNVPTGDYKIQVYLNNQLQNSTGEPYPHDQSDSLFHIVNTVPPTPTPTTGQNQEQNQSSNPTPTNTSSHGATNATKPTNIPTPTTKVWPTQEVKSASDDIQQATPEAKKNPETKKSNERKPSFLQRFFIWVASFFHFGKKK